MGYLKKLKDVSTTQVLAKNSATVNISNQAEEEVLRDAIQHSKNNNVLQIK